MSQPIKIYKYVSYSSITLVILFLLPLVINAKWETISGLMLNNSDLFGSTMVRGVVFSLITSIISVLIAFVLATSLRKVSVISNASKWLSLLFIPFFLGNVSIAFIFKILFLQSGIMSFAYSSSFKLYFILGLIQVWQFGSLFTYLFWLSFQSISNNKIEYALNARMSKWEFQRDVVMPHAKNMLILLFLLAFIFNFYEDAKLSLIFRASQGTGSELISQWLYRNFRADILINFDYASTKVFSTSLYIIIPLILTLVFFSILLFNKGILTFCRKRMNFSRSHFSNKRKGKKANLTILLLAITIIIPIALSFVSLGKISFSSAISKLAEPAYLTALAAIGSSIFAILFAISSRLAWPSKMSSFNKFSSLYISVLFIVLVVPPIALMVSGFYWIRILDISGIGSIVTFWLLGHCFLTLPILGSFLLINHFRVSEDELIFHKVHKSRIIDVVKNSFTKRFKMEYILTFIFAFSLIWNEAVLNRVFSDSIPSFVSAIIGTISSRNADFSVGFAYFCVSLSLALICMVLWMFVIKKAKKILIVDEKVRS